MPAGFFSGILIAVTASLPLSIARPAVPPIPANPTERATVFLPKEHGSWSLAFEPVALGLLVAPSMPGAALALATVSAFFARRPFKALWTAPKPAGMHVALPAAVILTALALAALLVAALVGGLSNLWPLLLAVPFGVLFVLFESRGESRAAAAELAGTTTFALLPAAFATLAGWQPAPALALATLMLARAAPTVLYVRAYLRQAKSLPASPVSALLAALAAAGAAATLVAVRLVPAVALPLGLVLLARTGFFLGRWRPAFSARRVGLIEAVLGVVFLAALVLAYRG